MNGGLLEGLRKIFLSRTSLKINSILFGIIAVVYGLAALIVFSIPGFDKLSDEVQNQLILQELVVKQPVVGVLILLCTLVLAGYIFLFARNAIKYFVAVKATPERANLDILPEIDVKKSVKFILGVVWIALVWLLYIVIASLIIVHIPIVNVVFLIVIPYLLYTIFPMLFLEYVDTNKIKPLLTISTALNILKKTFFPVCWVYVKLLGLAILATFIGLLLGLLLALINQRLCFIVLMIFASYLSIIVFPMVMYYNLAYVYVNKLKET